MNRIEFIDKLQRALAGALSGSQVAENVRYYQEYINGEIQKGRTEEEVIASLGEPRLLAKSIIEANKRTQDADTVNETYDEEFGTVEEEKQQSGRTMKMPGWLLLLIVVVILLLVIGVVFSIIGVLAPIIIPVLVVILIIRLLQDR